MNTKATIAVGVAALIAGAAIGYFCRPAQQDAQEGEAAKSVEAKTAHKAARGADDAALNRLRKRVQSLERELAVARNAPKAAKTPQNAEDAEEAKTDRPRTRRFRPPSPEEMRAELEEIRKNDPQRYAQMTNRHETMKRHRLERAQGRLDILGSVDTSRFSQGQKAVHEQYQDAVVRREELRELMDPSNADLSEEQRRSMFEEMRGLDRQIRELAESERSTLLTKAVEDLGVRGDALQDAVETVKAIYEATQTRDGHNGPPPGPPPGGVPR